MPQQASRGRSALKTLGFPGGKGRVLGIKDQAPRPEVRPLKATLLESVSRREKSRIQEIWNLCFISRQKRKRKTPAWGVSCRCPQPSPLEQWSRSVQTVHCRLRTLLLEKSVLLFWGGKRRVSEQALSRSGATEEQWHLHDSWPAPGIVLGTCSWRWGRGRGNGKERAILETLLKKNLQSKTKKGKSLRC